MNTFNLRLDLDKAPTLPLWVTIRQGDKNGTTISASIYDHGTLLAGSYNARIAFQLPDGEHYYRKDATFSSGVATVTIDETEAASVTGNTVGYFEILSGSTVIASTANFGIHVLQSATDGMTPGEVYDSAIQDAIDGLNEAVAELPDTVEGILEDHPEWTTTVQDGSISVPKLASDVRSSLSGAILAAIGGTLVTAHDAAAVPPNSASLFGRSAQSGTPTPSSPVAITSIDAAELGFAGLNLMPQPIVGYSMNTSTGIPSQTNTNNFVTPKFPCVSGSLTLVVNSTGTYGGSFFFTCYAQDGTYLGVTNGAYFNSITVPYRANFTLRSGTAFVCAYGYYSSGAAKLLDAEIAIYDGTVSTPLVPYQGSTLAIDLQGHELRSLPDGTRDEVTVDQYGHATLIQRVGHVVLTGATEEGWAYNSTTSRVYTSTNFGAVSYINTGTHAGGAISDRYQLLASGGTSVTGNVGFEFGSANIFLKDATNAPNLNDWKTWLAANPVTMDFMLATPTTIDLGYVTLPTLPAPDLTAWAAQGAELALTYQRDATMAIAGIYAQLAPVDGPTATSNHGVGTYLMLGGTLCKVTTAIAAGETIAIGTNVVATNVMTEILALTA